MDNEEFKRNEFIRLDMAAEANSMEAVVEWLCDELVFWEKVISSLNEYRKDVIGSTGVEAEVINHLQKVRGLKDEVEANGKSPKIVSGLIKKLIREDDLPFFDDALSRSLQKSISTQQSLTAAVMVFRGYNFSRTAALESFENFWEGGLRGEIEAAKAKTYSDLNAFNKTITDDAKRHLDAINESGQKKVQAVRDSGEETVKKSSQALKDLAVKISNDIISAAPVAFWESKVRHHKIRSIIFAASSAIMILLAVGIIGLLIYFTQMSNMDKLEELVGIPIPDHYPIALTILVGAAGVWVTKIALKLMMTNLALESEAYAKATTIKTYVALSNTTLSEETVNLFHKSLLNSSPGDFSGDMASPELVKIIELVLKKQK